VKYQFIIIFLLFAVFKNSVYAAAADHIPNFIEVNQNIYRGGRPSKAGLDELKTLGIKTIINLENNQKAVAFEKKYLKSEKGLNYFSIPMASLKTPRDADVAAVLNILKDSKYYPIFIHCQHGQDRTGLVMGLFRVFIENWTPGDAYQEMLDKGFHKILFPLDHYYEKKTGSSPLRVGSS